jgi:hypothetical protein
MGHGLVKIHMLHFFQEILIQNAEFDQWKCDISRICFIKKATRKEITNQKNQPTLD